MVGCWQGPIGAPPHLVPTPPPRFPGISPSCTFEPPVEDGAKQSAEAALGRQPVVVGWEWGPGEPPAWLPLSTARPGSASASGTAPDVGAAESGGVGASAQDSAPLLASRAARALHWCAGVEAAGGALTPPAAETLNQPDVISGLGGLSLGGTTAAEPSGSGSGGSGAGVCAQCGGGPAAGQERLLKCGRCKGVRYCGPECQKAHWPVHKQECKRLAAQAAAAGWD